MRAKILNVVVAGILTSIVAIPLARAVSQEFHLNATGVVQIIDESGRVLDDNKLSSVAWIVVNMTPTYDLKQVEEPQVAMAIVVHKTTFEVEVDQSLFYWGEWVWTLEELRSNLSTGEFLPAEVYDPQG